MTRRTLQHLTGGLFLAAAIAAAPIGPTGGLTVPILSDAAARAAESTDKQTAADFITDLGDRAIGALTDKSLEPETRQERFRTLLREGLDLEHVGHFVLGAYRRRASEEQMETFLALLEDNIVNNYAWRFRNYSGETIEVTGVQDAPRDAAIVQTRLDQKEGAPPITVDWRVHDTEDGLKVIDIVVEGISMMVTQRDEYVGFMRTNGGIDGLIEALRKQNAALAARQNG